MFVVRWKVIKVIVVYFVSNDWFIIYLDVKMVFFNGNLYEIIYVEIFEDF